MAQSFIPTNENINNEGKTLISFFAKLAFLCGILGECQELVSVRNVDVQQPKILLGELVVCCRKSQPSFFSLLSDAEECWRTLMRKNM